MLFFPLRKVSWIVCLTFYVLLVFYTKITTQINTKTQKHRFVFFFMKPALAIEPNERRKKWKRWTTEKISLFIHIYRNDGVKWQNELRKKHPNHFWDRYNSQCMLLCMVPEFHFGHSIHDSPRVSFSLSLPHSTFANISCTHSVCKKIKQNKKIYGIK